MYRVERFNRGCGSWSYVCRTELMAQAMDVVLKETRKRHNPERGMRVVCGNSVLWLSWRAPLSGGDV